LEGKGHSNLEGKFNKANWREHYTQQRGFDRTHSSLEGTVHTEIFGENISHRKFEGTVHTVTWKGQDTQQLGENRTDNNLGGTVHREIWWE
jgi:hypothetical protein